MPTLINGSAMALAVVNRAQRSVGKLLLFPLLLLMTSHPWEMKLWMPMQQWVGWMTQILTAADWGRRSHDGWVSDCCSSGIDGTRVHRINTKFETAHTEFLARFCIPTQIPVYLVTSLGVWKVIRLLSLSRMMVCTVAGSRLAS